MNTSKYSLFIKNAIQIIFTNSLFPKFTYKKFCCTLVQGFDKLQEMVEKWDGLIEMPSRYNLKLFADKHTYESMDELALLQNKTAHQLAMEVIRNYVASQQRGKGE